MRVVATCIVILIVTHERERQHGLHHALAHV
jgi:hypothetical protein